MGRPKKRRCEGRLMRNDCKPGWVCAWCGAEYSKFLNFFQEGDQCARYYAPPSQNSPVLFPSVNVFLNAPRLAGQNPQPSNKGVI